MSTKRGLAVVTVLILALAGAALLTGCATKEEPAAMTASVCYLRFLGKTNEGYSVVMQVCQSPEAFAASQQ